MRGMMKKQIDILLTLRTSCFFSGVIKIHDTEQKITYFIKIIMLVIMYEIVLYTGIAYSEQIF
jgi:hypothetical protein